MCWALGLLAPSPECDCLICASCSSGRHFACSFLQIPDRSGHPCCSACGSHTQGPQRTSTSKSSTGYQPGQMVPHGTTRHAWRTKKSQHELFKLSDRPRLCIIKNGAVRDWCCSARLRRVPATIATNFPCDFSDCGMPQHQSSTAPVVGLRANDRSGDQHRIRRANPTHLFAVPT